MKSTWKCLALPLVFAAILFSLGAESAFALEKPKHLTATFDAAIDKLVVKWGEVADAEKYRIIVKRTDGVTVVKSTTRGMNKKFSGSKFEAAVVYKVQVQSLAEGASSKFATKSYAHTLSRASGKGVLLTVNSFGRSGSYYLPPKFEKKPRPLLVAFHGQGGEGDSMVKIFSSLAEEFGFIIVAPSSGLMSDGTSAWTVGTLGTATADYIHIRNCIDEVLAFTNVAIDQARVLAVGVSAGGAVAPYFATSNVNTEFTHFAVLHGGVVFNTLGDRIIPAWLSTGSQDTLRPPGELQAYQSALQALGFNVIYSEYPNDHDVSKKERRGVVEWWLDR